MIALAPPAIVAEAARGPHRLALGIRVDLDPGRVCNLPTAAEYAIEPDNGEAGVDSCGSPSQARVLVRVNGRLAERCSVRLHTERGFLRVSVPVVKGAARWSVTVVGLLGRLSTVRGVA